jgi:polyisoprenyl-teichoic acid--peptidoglycan teichoic acid transferase
VTRLVRAAFLTGLVLVIGTAGVVAGHLRAGATVFRFVQTDSASLRWEPDKPLWVLLLGDDARRNAGCGCSDAMHLVGVPAGGGRAVLLNIPRDLRVNVPGHGMRRINEAYARGGAHLAAEVVGRTVGVPISVTVVTTWGGLPAMIDELGGVTVNVPVAIRDKKVGASFGPGPVLMNGATAMAFARSRNFPDGDLTRTRHQGLLILAVLAKLRAEGTSPAQTLRYLSVFLRHTKSVGLTTPELYRLGRAALAVDPGAVRMVTVPVKPVMISGMSMVEALPSATPLFRDLADDAILQSH